MAEMQPEPEVAWVLDEIEAAAWRDVVAATPERVGAAIGLCARRIGPATMILAPGLQHPLFNRVVGLGNGQPATDAIVDEVIARFASVGVHAPCIHVGPAAAPAALPDWLAARGFAATPGRARLEVVRGREPVPAIEAGLEVREVGRDDAARLASVLVAVHGHPSILVPQVEALVGRPRWRAYAAFAGDDLVAGAMLFVDDRRAWLGMNGVLRSHRRRGVHGGLIARCVRDAIAQGAAVIAAQSPTQEADPAGTTLDDLLRCGFRAAGARLEYSLARDVC
jgi:Acetyltransferase (GNAT) domain